MGRDLLGQLLECEGFQWDHGNAPKLWKRHKVIPDEAEQVFLNRPIVVAPDIAHSRTEFRCYALGRTDGGRGLFVVFTIRGNLIRVILARDMSRRERMAYERAEETSGESDPEV